MLHQIIEIDSRECEKAQLYTYFLDNYQEIDLARKRPVVIICPGGAYGYTSEREAEAIAIQYNARGLHACVLKYHCAPAEYPTALLELAKTVSHLRQNAEQYHIDPDKIIISGFSAGGHLAGSLGVFWHQDWLQTLMQEPMSNYKPNGLLLCYPVLISGEKGHQGSFTNLLGSSYTEELKAMLSLETQVTEYVPPTFIWHTQTDNAVPVEGTLMFATALQKVNVSYELHIYPVGGHGLALASRETMANGYPGSIQKECQNWIRLACTWAHNL